MLLRKLAKAIRDKIYPPRPEEPPWWVSDSVFQFVDADEHLAIMCSSFYMGIETYPRTVEPVFGELGVSIGQDGSATRLLSKDVKDEYLSWDRLDDMPMMFPCEEPDFGEDDVD